MLRRVVERMRGATSVHELAVRVIGGLAVEGVRSALVLCDAAGEPTLWIGDDPTAGQAYLDGGFRDDPCFLRVWSTQAATREGELWVAPVLGEDAVIGMLRARTAHADDSELATIASYVSIKLALLGVDGARGLASVTPRQREVAELVVHGCTNAEIARMLAISPNAVKKHVSRVLAALEVSNRTELAALMGRWRNLSRTDQVLPPGLHVVVRNRAKPAAAVCRPGSA